MPETITVRMPAEKDDAGTFTIFLRSQTTGALLNTGGDVLTRVENPPGTFTGLRTFTLAETRSGNYDATIYEGTAEDASFLMYTSFLLSGKTVVGEELAPTGGGGGGDNTEVLEAIDGMKSIISEWIALNVPTDVRGFPATIIGGTDVTVSLEVVDSNDDPITEIFGESVETVQWLFGMGTSARRARILGSVEWTSDDLLLISMAKADTLSEDDGPRTWMIGCKLTSGELKWVKTGVTRLIGRQFAEPTTTTTGA